MVNYLHRLWQKFHYGIMNNASDIDLSDIPTQISLQPHYDRKNEVYWVESKDLPDFEATGKTLEELAEHIGDALLVYFDVPHYFAKNYIDGVMTISDPKTGSSQPIRISRQGIERALATQ